MKRLKIAIGLFSNLLGLEKGAKPYFLTPFSTDIDENAKRAAVFLSTDPGKEIFHCSDIQKLSFEEIQNQLNGIGYNVKKGDVDLLMGGPPCFGITPLNANHRSVFHNLNFLMIEMLRMVEEMQPKVVLMEQVPALFTKPMRPFLYLFINAIERLGNYRWECQILNAENFGCFQSRKRAIFILVREDLGVKPSFPAPQPVDLSKQSAYAAIGAELIMNTQFRKEANRKPRITNGRTSVFPTLTSSKVNIFRNGLWEELSLADRKILAHMEGFLMSDVLSEPILVKKLGMMVLPPFADALCKHIYENILLKAA